MTRILVFTLVGFLLITLLGPLQTLFGFDIAVLDVPLITVLYLVMTSRALGYGRPLHIFSSGIDWSGGVTGLILGYITDVLGGGIKGIHSLTLVVMYLICLWAARHVYLAGMLSVLVVTFIASTLSSIVAVNIRWMIGVPPSLSTLTVIVSQATLTAAAAPLLIKLYRFIDAKLSPEASERGSLCR
jgi:cell shape-determining protein MreD